MLLPKKIAFRNNLLVPYHEPLKLGLSANNITLSTGAIPGKNHVEYVP